jgi:hypothetical protein
MVKYNHHIDYAEFTMPLLKIMLDLMYINIDEGSAPYF